ncbi:hypothetical protein GCM10023238_32030 [Streptomyces heliomycini]
MPCWSPKAPPAAPWCRPHAPRHGRGTHRPLRGDHRCPLEVQDCLLSLLSERVVAVPELDGDDGMVFARQGFNVIATANTRDRGVNEMSAALKRRFNFETVFPIPDLDTELALVEAESTALLRESGVERAPDRDLLEVLVGTFREQRGAPGQDDRPSAVMSTAEAVSTAHAVGPARLVPARRGRQRRRHRLLSRRHRRQGQPRGPRPPAPASSNSRPACAESPVAGPPRRPAPAGPTVSTARVHLPGGAPPLTACAGLVRRTIRELRPAYVLVEGPADMNDRIGELLLGHELPIAVFSH